MDTRGFAWIASVEQIGCEFAAHYFKATLIAIKEGCCLTAFAGLRGSRGAIESSCVRLQKH